MTFELLAIAWFVVVTVVAAGVIVRTLRSVPQVGDAAICGGCGASAAKWVAFDCPRCGVDVRQVGLALPVARAPMTALWRLIGWTLAVLLIAAGGTYLLTIKAEPVRHVNMSVELPLRGVTGGRVDRAVAYFVGVGERRRGDLYVDFHFVDRTVGVLHVSLPTSETTWTLPGEPAAETRAGPYSRDVLDRWLSACQLPTPPRGDPEKNMLDALHRRIEFVVEGGDVFAAEPVRTQWPWWSGGGSVGWPLWLNAVCVTAWPTLWLVGLIAFGRWLRVADRRGPS